MSTSSSRDQRREEVCKCQNVKNRSPRSVCMVHAWKARNPSLQLSLFEWEIVTFKSIELEKRSEKNEDCSSAIRSEVRSEYQSRKKPCKATKHQRLHTEADDDQEVLNLGSTEWLPVQEMTARKDSLHLKRVKVTSPPAQ